MILTPVPPAVPPGGLAALNDVVLTTDLQRLLDQAAELSGGPAPWRRRKLAEARDLLALTQIAGRLKPMALDLREALRAMLWMQVSLPCLAEPDGELAIADQAVLGLTYPQEALRQQLPGYAFIQVLAPDHVWHANVSAGPIRSLCLGPQLPAGIRVKELILMAYGALSMQTVQIDEQDPAGVMNADAARWWQRNLHRAPLSRTPFLSTDA